MEKIKESNAMMVFTIASVKLSDWYKSSIRVTPFHQKRKEAATPSCDWSLKKRIAHFVDRRKKSTPHGVLFLCIQKARQPPPNQKAQRGVLPSPLGFLRNGAAAAIFYGCKK